MMPLPSEQYVCNDHFKEMAALVGLVPWWMCQSIVVKCPAVYTEGRIGECSGTGLCTGHQTENAIGQVQ